MQRIPDFYRLSDGTVVPGHILRKAIEDTGVEIKYSESEYHYVDVDLYQTKSGNMVAEPKIMISEDVLSEMFDEDLIKKTSVSMKGVCNETGKQNYLGNRESRRKKTHKRTVGQTNKSVRGKRKRKKRSK